MNTSLSEDALDFLDDDAKRLVKEMLRAVVEHPDLYPNGFSVTRSKRGEGYEYFLATSGGPGPFRNHQRLATNITDQLVFHRIAEGKRNPQWPDTFRSFTDAALDWQRTYGGVIPDDIRKKLGQAIKQLVPTTGKGNYIPFDPEMFSTLVGATPQQIEEQFAILCGAGLVDTTRIGDSKIGVLGLSSPAGHLWAEQGYRSIHSSGSQPINVSVSLHVEIRNIIQEVSETGLPDETQKEFEALLYRAKEELEKPAGQGRFSRIRDVMAFSADFKEVVPSVGKLVAEHGDKIQQMIDLAL